MKKVLLGATALTLVGFVGAASAQTVSTPRFNTSIGGFMTLGFGYVDTEVSDTPAVGATNGGTEWSVVNNAEVIFNFSLVADNGLTFGAKVEFEANGQANNVDEYVGFVSGSFGRVEVGAEDGAHDILVGGPVGGNFTSAADGAGFLFDYNSNGVAAPNTQGNDTGDGLKITYYTPTFAGFRAGVSFAPNGTEGPVATPVNTDAGQGIEVGAQYNNTFGDFSLFLAGGATFFTESGTTANQRDWSYTLNANVGFAGFRVGAIWGYTEWEQGEESAYGIGADYRTGPWYFGVQWGQNVDQRSVAQGGAGVPDDAYGISGEVNYALAPGVTAGAVVEYASDTTRTGWATDDSGFATGVFLGLSF